MYKAEDYTYRVFWSGDDNAYVATVSEFPSLSCIEKTQEDAFFGMVSLMRFVLNDMEESGEEAPVPFSKREYSGSLRVRLPKEQHRRIALEAAEQGVSMNQLIVSRI